MLQNLKLKICFEKKIQILIQMNIIIHIKIYIDHIEN